MVSKEQKKIERVINFMKKGLASLADDLEDTVKGINDFIKSLAKAQKDLKEVSVAEEVQTVSTSSKKVVAPASANAKTAAASTLFSLLSGGSPATTPSAAPMTSIPAAPAPPGGGPPSAPKAPAMGPPKAPSAGPPSAPPSGGPPKKPSLPPAPKLPPAGGGPPAAPSAGPPKAPSAGPPAAPAFAKRPGPPSAGPPAAPMTPGAASVAPKAGGGLSSLRDEMLDELNRLKKIMRGE
ncbi:MAG: hypothetical protein ACFFCY_15945 [Promethearchaeota archaeon]